jgi:hypothetical protein
VCAVTYEPSLNNPLFRQRVRKRQGPLTDLFRRPKRIAPTAREQILCLTLASYSKRRYDTVRQERGLPASGGTDDEA